MQPTPGITDPKLCVHPLGTEAELTPGPNDYNPYDDVEDSQGIPHPFDNDRDTQRDVEAFHEETQDEPAMPEFDLFADGSGPSLPLLEGF